jgi:tetratricopeptide (TPR) repeat protein
MRDVAAALADMKERRFLRFSAIEEAFRRVDLRAFLPDPLRAAAYIDAPLPLEEETGAPLVPSPRIASLLLHLVDLEPGLRMFVVGGGGYVAALASHVLESPVTLLPTDAIHADVVGEALRRAGYGDAVVVVHEAEGKWDRVLVVEPAWEGAELLACVAEDGFLLAARGEGADRALVKLLRKGGDFVEIAIQGLDLQGMREAIDVTRELVLEQTFSNVWRGRTTSAHDKHFQSVVEETFLSEEEADARFPPADVRRWRLARTLFHLAYIHQTIGASDQAIATYKASLAVWPTAEAHTFLGWTYSFLNRYDDAIAECRKAIAVDPGFGNPYNDIGAYLLERGEADAAIPWFEKAIRSKRYCCYFYPHANLGRAYLMKGMRERARQSLEDALRVNPEYAYAREMLRRLDSGSDSVA